jgi:hypothetical protein
MQQASSPVPANQSGHNINSASSRNVWVYTGYVAAAVALLGVLAYHFSSVILK